MAFLHVLSAVLSLFTFLSVVPFLRILFKSTSLNAIQVDVGFIRSLLRLFVAEHGRGCIGDSLLWWCWRCSKTRFSMLRCMLWQEFERG